MENFWQKNTALTLMIRFTKASSNPPLAFIVPLASSDAAGYPVSWKLKDALSPVLVIIDTCPLTLIIPVLPLGIIKPLPLSVKFMPLTVP